MSNIDKDKIELEIRRMISENELEIRRSLVDELDKHRGYLQAQFRTLTLGLSALAAVASFLFIFFFSRSFNGLEEDIKGQIDQKVVEYKIVESFNTRLSQKLDLIVQSDRTQNLIKDRAEKILDDQVSVKLKPLIDDAIARSTEGFDKASVEKLISQSINTEVNRLFPYRILASIRVSNSKIVSNSEGVTFNIDTGIITFPNPQGLTIVPLVTHINGLHYATQTTYIREVIDSKSFRVWNSAMDTGANSFPPHDFTALIIGIR